MSQSLSKILSLFLSFYLILEQSVFAQTIDLSHYFARNPAQTVLQSDKFRPLHLRYISYDTETNDFQILLDKGDFFNQKPEKPKNEKTLELEKTSQELMKYFFIGLALPNEKFWVNLRPDSPDNILDPDLEKTDIGRIFLEADLQLKKDTSKMTSPQTPEGKAYWDKLYKKAGELFPAVGGSAFGGGAENITIPAITRPWIVPAETIIGESPEGAYIYKATLKVMLEEDYLRGTKGEGRGTTINYSFNDPRLKELNEYSTQLIKETIIPKLTYAVNTSKRYAPLRQVYYSLILAQWFKQKYSPGSAVSGPRSEGNSYIKLINSENLANLTSNQPYDKQDYFQKYQKSFKDGEYNLQEPIYSPAGQSIRRYMSGGLQLNSSPITLIEIGKPINIRPYLTSVGSPITDAFIKKPAEILFQSLLSLHKERLKALPEDRNTILEGWSFWIKDAIADAVGLSLEEKVLLGKIIHDATPSAHKHEYIAIAESIAAKNGSPGEGQKRVQLVVDIVEEAQKNIQNSNVFGNDEKNTIQKIFHKVHNLTSSSIDIDRRLLASSSAAAETDKDSDIQNLSELVNSLKKLENWNVFYKKAAQNTKETQKESPVTINGHNYYVRTNFASPLAKHLKGVVIITSELTGRKFVLKRLSHSLEAEIHNELSAKGISVPNVLSLTDELDKKYLLMDYIEGEEISIQLYNNAGPSNQLKYLFKIFSKKGVLDSFVKDINIMNGSGISHNDLENFRNLLFTGNKIVFIDFGRTEKNVKKPDNAKPLINNLNTLSQEAKKGLKNNKNAATIKRYIKFANAMVYRLSSSPASNKQVPDKGGIDFSHPEIISRPVNELQSLAGSPLTVNPDLDFEAEWRGIQMVFNAGIRPSARRMAEFAVSASASPLNSRRLEDLRGLVTDLLRRDEEDEKPAPADSALKELLAIL